MDEPFEGQKPLSGFSFSECFHLHNRGNPDSRVRKTLGKAWARKVSYMVRQGSLVKEEVVSIGTETL